MRDDDVVEFVPVADIASAVESVVAEERDLLAGLLPRAEVHHVGATAIPGSLTKGDVDLAVRVRAEDFPRTVDALRQCYDIAQPENWTPTYASFAREREGRLPVGIQVSVLGSRDDFFVSIRDALRSDRSLLDAYNALKRAHEGATYQAYTEAKEHFLGPVLDETQRR